MCGRAYKPRFLFSWPNSKCSVMGPDQLTGTINALLPSISNRWILYSFFFFFFFFFLAVGVMDIVFREAAKKSGQQIDEGMAQMRKEMFKKLVEDQSSAYFTSSRIIDDGIIDPRHTRTVLGLCLSAIYSNEVKGDNICGVSRM